MPGDGQSPEGVDAEQRRREQVEEFNKLPEGKRRRLVQIEPFYRDYYNELVQPNVELRVPAYFFRKWAKRLNPGAVLIYLQLRQMCFYDLKNPQNTRDYCWPSHGRLADWLGVGRRSIIRYLKVLEDHELIFRIRPDRNEWKYDKELGKKTRPVDKYRVPYELPLAAEDLGKMAVRRAEELLAEEDETPSKYSGSPLRQIGTKVSFPRPGRQNGTGVGAKLAQKDILEEDSIPTSANGSGKRGRTTTAFARDPRVANLTREERRHKERLFIELISLVAEKSGDRTGEPLQYEGLFRRAAFLMPSQLVGDVIREFSGYVADAREGSKDRVANHSKLLWGFIRRKAEQNDVDLTPNPA